MKPAIFAKLVPLKGSVPVNKHQLIGPADATERLDVTVKLRRRSEKGLPTHAEFIAGKRARGITRQILAERYGATREDAEFVQRWARQHGLSVSHIELGLRRMNLVGTAAAMSSAFGVTLSTYRHSRTGVHFRCPEADIRIPKELVPIITGVFGLNNMPVVVRRPVRASAVAAAAQKDPKQTFPGSFYPHEVSKLYNFPPTQGAGQRVAIFEFGGGFSQAVLKDYFTKNIGLQTPPTVNGISVLGTSIQVDRDVTGEVYLDIEVIGAMAPKAIIDVYFAPWTGQGYLAAVEQAIHNDDYAAISISYGLDEDVRGSAANPGWPMLHQNLEEAFRDAAAVGIPLFVSTGDQGSSSVRGQIQIGGQQIEVTGFSKTTHEEYPCTSPYVTAVGGTLLYAEGGAITKELVWNELGPLQQNAQGSFYFGGATGGGVSDRFPIPSYQSKAGISFKSVNKPAVAGRAVPDVAGNAGSTTGYLVSQPPGSTFPIAPVGGTSASAPMWAGLMACIRETLDIKFSEKMPVFFLNDFIYAVGKSAAFRDIVGGRDFTLDQRGELTPGDFIPVGNNRSTQADGYYAAEGFDLCTGWGSPNGIELLSVLQTWLEGLKT